MNEGADIKVIESKTICYCSNFDLNVNEWFNEYENLEIFKMNMKKNLGKYLLEYMTWRINPHILSLCRILCLNQSINQS